MSPPYLIFDIGATKTRLSLSSDGKTLGSPIIVPTQKRYDDQIDQIKKITDELLEHKPTMAVIGLAGGLNQKRDSLCFSPNLPDWKNKNIKTDLEKILGTPVHIENDASLCGLGEAVFGAGKAEKIVVYLTVSTGVNGIRIVDGKIDEGAFAPEIGDQIINFDVNHDFDNYGTGSLEDYIGGSSIKKRKGRGLEEEDKEEWEEVCYLTSIGIHNSILYWRPNIVILGGAIGVKMDLSKINKHVDDMTVSYENKPKVVHSELKDMSGLWGALAFVA